MAEHNAVTSKLNVVMVVLGRDLCGSSIKCLASDPDRGRGLTGVPRNYCPRDFPKFYTDIFIWNFQNIKLEVLANFPVEGSSSIGLRLIGALYLLFTCMIIMFTFIVNRSE